MWKKIGLAIVGLLGLFLAYVATRPSQFRYERSALIKATPEQIYPIVSDLNQGVRWSPYEQRDPNMKKTIEGNKMTFDGNNEVGAGTLEITKTVPNQSVELRLLMTKPMSADNLIQYTLVPEADGTRFTWAMSGDGGFMGKLMGVIIDCEKMIGGDMEIGIANLKKLVEGV